MTAISVRNISKNFGETRALRDASLEASFAEIHAIVGENGSGKSTLAKIISGIVLADGGDVDVLGHRPNSPTEAIAIGVSTIFQEMMLAESLTIWENVFAGSDSFWKRSSSVAEKKRQTKEILERLADCPIDPDWPVSAVPLSVKQWIVISRALLQKPKVLVFDESSAALDLDATSRLHHEMLELKASGTAVIIVTHRIAELVKFADQATVLRDGVTVGKIGREEMTEENLLRLMSATTGHSARAASKEPVFVGERHPLLEASNIGLTDGAQGFDFNLHPGQIVGIAGLDGAGQAEFVRILAGIDKAPQGRVTVRDDTGMMQAISNLSDAEANRIAYVSGDRKKEGIFANLSIMENFGLALYGRHSNAAGVIDQKALREVFDREKDRLSIKFGHRQDKITTLSGGNQQKVLIARAFALAPRIIILNDPARGVDIGTKQDLYTHLRAFAAGGGAVIYLSTEIEEFFNFADRADVFFEGHLFASFEQDRIGEESILGAMFGQSEPVDMSEALEQELPSNIQPQATAS
ncbi:sugar ABC transporter ATP-binding protein [Donghicola sp. C2-DW-16]|uniref:Sugar ABC transporter ATP-binding protein n=1 Tax=Donghicola mangrovi TaxID=2729614 RepID=A0ABX2PCV9_9RHOB|nr:sugar ABC transporter ATP-binding protein [Donghicola mangrovi]NVO27312.1 sugar ABC transporter ATP-binding protein [Donghicola mangrovi]